MEEAGVLLIVPSLSVRYACVGRCDSETNFTRSCDTRSASMALSDCIRHCASRRRERHGTARQSGEARTGLLRSMRSKRLADLNLMERLAQENDMTEMTKAETAQLKADREAARAKYAQMSAEEKAALRKATQQKKLGELSVMERVGQ